MDDYIKREDAIMTAMDYDGQGNAQDASQDIAADLASIPAADVRENEWISVDNALPPDGQIVIGAVYTTDIIHLNAGESLEDGLKRTNKEAEQHPRVEPCWYGHDGSGDPETVGWYGYDGFPMVCHPRYWMPLPQPPEVKEWAL